MLPWTSYVSTSLICGGSEIDPPSVNQYSRKEGREMVYLTTHTTHFILRLYGVEHMVKDHSDNERGNPLLPHGILFPINSKGSFYMHHPSKGSFMCIILQMGNTYHGLCYTSLGALVGTKKNCSMGPPLRIDPTTHRTMIERSYHGATSSSPLFKGGCSVHYMMSMCALSKHVVQVRTQQDLSVLHDWCNKGRGMCNPVSGMVHIKEHLLLIGK